MGLHVSELNKEWSNTELVTVNNELSKDNSMSADSTHVSRPPLGSSGVWCVDDELIRIHVKGSGCLERANVRAMTKFSLSIAAHHAQVSCLVQPLLVLLITGNILK